MLKVGVLLLLLYVGTYGYVMQDMEDAVEAIEELKEMVENVSNDLEELRDPVHRKKKHKPDTVEEMIEKVDKGHPDLLRKPKEKKIPKELPPEARKGPDAGGPEAPADGTDASDESPVDMFDIEEMIDEAGLEDPDKKHKPDTVEEMIEKVDRGHPEKPKKPKKPKKEKKLGPGQKPAPAPAPGPGPGPGAGPGPGPGPEEVAGPGPGPASPDELFDIGEMIEEVNQNSKDLHDVDLIDRPDLPGPIEKRNFITNKAKIWSYRDIAYVLHSSLSARSKMVIKQAFSHFKARTCIQFHAKTQADKYYLNFFSGRGCYSSLGYTGGMSWNKLGYQSISIKNNNARGSGCGYKGIVEHEIMHALGFFHEQARPDRNKYITVKWENIKTGLESQFFKQTNLTLNTLGLGYDYGGIMHYGSYAFSKNGKKTIEVIHQPNGTQNPAPKAKIGQRAGMSQIDIDQINLAYACTKTGKANMYSAWSEWSVCNGLCQKERNRICFHQDVSKCEGEKKVTLETQNCTDCAVNGGYSHWGRWTLGNINGNRPKTRTRTCTNPAPFGKGLECIGINKEELKCYNYVPDFQCAYWARYCLRYSYVRDRCRLRCGVEIKQWQVKNAKSEKYVTEKFGKQCNESANTVLTCEKYVKDKSKRCTRWANSGVQGRHCAFTITWTDWKGNKGTTSQKSMKEICPTTCKSCQ